jgi:two-component system, LytTR family, sensor histidine kinase AlgZ
MKSIRQIERADGGGVGLERHAARLPDWRNFGVMLRVLLGANVLAMVAALLQASELSRWGAAYVMLAAWLEIPLILVLGGLVGLRNLLWRLSLRQGQAVVIVIAALAGFLQADFWQWLGLVDVLPGAGLRAGLLAAGLAGGLLFYFELQARARSPAVVEARLLALNARIRPHFLFNSLNAVLSLIRAEPRRAEEALETLSDLFRAALRDPREWMPLSEELALCRQYLDMEKLRLGERLRVDWVVDDVPMDMSIPPLMLQPLVENAVYHGVEPSPEGGDVRISFARRGEELQIAVENPCHANAGESRGNHMALANIRERLALYYDLEARLEIETQKNRYRICICLPCRTKSLPSAS